MQGTFTAMVEATQSSWDGTRQKRQLYERYRFMTIDICRSGASLIQLSLTIREMRKDSYM